MLNRRAVLWKLGLFVAVLFALTGCLGGGTSNLIPDKGQTLAIKSVNLGVNNLIVLSVGTTLEEILEDVLPKNAQVTLSNNSVQTGAVVWTGPDNFDKEQVGEYIFKGTLKVGDLTKPVELTVRLTDEIEISQDIMEARTLTSDYSYRVTDKINIGATLTIEPDVLIRFENDTYFDITSTGAIIANGTGEKPILLTGTEKQRGWWQGVRVGSISTTNSLSYVTIEYGGGSGFDYNQSANLVLGHYGGPGRIQLNNNTFRESAGYGFSVYPESTFSGERNTYTSNTEGAVHMPATHMHLLDGGSDYQGNEQDYVFVDGQEIDFSGTITWQALNVPYRINDKIIVDKAKVTVEPGATFVFEADAALGFEAGSKFKIGTVQDGQMQLSSLGGNPVVFTALEKVAGYWAGIRVDSPSPENTLASVIIEYAGANWGANTVQAALAVGDGSSGRVQMNDSIVRYSGQYGMHIGVNGNFAGYGNEFTGNAEAPIFLYPNKLHQLNSSSTYSGNMADYILVEDPTQLTPYILSSSEQRYWSGLDVPFRFASSVTVQKGTVNILPGAALEFNDDKMLFFHEESQLIANGTEAQPIVFTGTNKYSGAWRGIQIATMAANEMKHVIIEYSGSNWLETGSYAANLGLGSLSGVEPGRLELRNSIIRYGAGYGILFQSGTVINEDWFEVNEFIGNQEGNLKDRRS